jgi:hypothetical protein
VTGARQARTKTNLFNAAWRTWHFALQSSNAVLTKVNDVKFAAFYTGGICSDTCGSGQYNTVKMGLGKEFEGNTAAHEFGHVVSWKLKPWTWIGDYGYPT